MLKRWWILAALLLFIPFSGCKKSEGTKIKNFFGAPPVVSEVSVTKERKLARCQTAIDLCCVDPPVCSCCCSPDIVSETKIDIDLLTASARVTDATPPTATNPSDILVVVLRFLVPPPSSVSPGTPISQFSLEMFDNGPATLQVLGTVSPPVNVVSGDLAENDGIYTRKVYFGTNTTANAGTCLEENDRDQIGHTYSTFGATIDLAPTSFLTFNFTVQAIDRAGNIDTSSEFPVSIQGTFRESTQGQQRACGPPSGNGGCLPGP